MEYNFGEIMKSLRKKQDLTQEQLAEYLGVSSQAVSKWETNSAYPDIMMFPIIANFYGVTTDELLGVNLNRSNEIIENYFKKMEDLYEQWKLKEMVELNRKACYEFPGNLKLKQHLAWSLVVAQNVLETTKTENLNEAISLCQKVLERSIDTKLNLSTISLLCKCYDSLGDREKALEYANQLPHINQTKNHIIGTLGLKKGLENVDFIKTSITSYFDSLLNLIYKLVDIRNNNENFLEISEKIKILESLFIILETTFGKKLLDKNFRAYEIHRDIALLYLKKNDKESAISHLENAYKYAGLYNDYSDDDCYEGPLLRGKQAMPHSCWSQSALDDMRNEFTKPKYSVYYESIKEHPKFIALLNKIRNEEQSK